MKKFTALMTMMPPVATAGQNMVVSLHAIYDSKSDEHRKFAAATPSASFTLNVTPEFAAELETGKYVVTFEKVEE